MSAQVDPITTFDGSGEPPTLQMQNGNNTTNNNNGSSTTSSGYTTTESRPTKKHVYSRFLKKRPPDLYGQRHAIETDKCVNDSLRLLEKELKKIPNVKRSGLEQASVICPEIYESKEHRMLFLRCEQFNADLAALRMANYWNRRIELFGSKAFVSFTAANIREKNGKELSLGFLRVMPDTDGTGRCNIYVDPSVLEGHGYKDENMVRVAWYILHTALEIESTQQKGIVFVVYLKDTCVRHFDRSLVKLLANSIRGVLPVRVSAIHIFHAPYLFEVLFDVVSVLLGERLTKRMKMYSGEDEVIHDQLIDFGIFPSRLPVHLGGTLELDQDQWIVERENEGK